MSSSVSYSSSLNKAAIGGIVCGVLAFFLILGLIIFVLLRQRKSKLMNKNQEKESAKIQDFEVNSKEREPDIQAPITQSQGTTEMNTQAIESRILESTQSLNNFDLNLFPGPPREYSIRQIPEEEVIPSEVSPALQTINEQSPNLTECYKLPVITFSDHAFPMPASLLSAQSTFDRTDMVHEGESQDQLTNLPIKNNIILARPTQSHSKKASRDVTREEKLDFFPQTFEPHATLHPGFYMKSQNVPIKEKDRESPTLGIRNPVKITADSSSTHRNSHGRYRSDSESSKNSLSSINRKIISDEELERLGIGSKI
ncbi:hypothetical protein HI914_06562 [Erysiphe necator]|nr:hypothetical protein HI914_06562 [Erysiphe necator]